MTAPDPSHEKCEACWSNPHQDDCPTQIASWPAKLAARLREWHGRGSAVALQGAQLIERQAAQLEALQRRCGKAEALVAAAYGLWGERSDHTRWTEWLADAAAVVVALRVGKGRWDVTTSIFTKAWLDADGRHVWWRHECVDGWHTDMLPWPHWKAVDALVTPSIECTREGCGSHTRPPIEAPPDDWEPRTWGEHEAQKGER